MNLTLQQTEKLLKGSHQKFQLFAFSMMLTLLRKRYAENPSQPTVEGCTADINEFIGKYHAIMAADLAVIQNL
jgi:hypothetical protein